MLTRRPKLGFVYEAAGETMRGVRCQGVQRPSEKRRASFYQSPLIFNSSRVELLWWGVMRTMNKVGNNSDDDDDNGLVARVCRVEVNKV